MTEAEQIAELKRRINELEGVIGYISLQAESIKISVKKIQEQIRRAGE